MDNEEQSGYLGLYPPNRFLELIRSQEKKKHKRETSESSSSSVVETCVSPHHPMTPKQFRDAMSPLPPTPMLSSPPVSTQLMIIDSYRTSDKVYRTPTALLNDQEFETPETPTFNNLGCSPPKTPLLKLDWSPSEEEKNYNYSPIPATPQLEGSPPKTPFLPPTCTKPPREVVHLNIESPELPSPPKSVALLMPSLCGDDSTTRHYMNFKREDPIQLKTPEMSPFQSTKLLSPSDLDDTTFKLNKIPFDPLASPLPPSPTLPSPPLSVSFLKPEDARYHRDRMNDNFVENPDDMTVNVAALRLDEPQADTTSPYIANITKSKKKRSAKKRSTKKTMSGNKAQQPATPSPDRFTSVNPVRALIFSNLPKAKSSLEIRRTAQQQRFGYNFNIENQPPNSANRRNMFPTSRKTPSKPQFVQM